MSMIITPSRTSCVAQVACFPSAASRAPQGGTIPFTVQATAT